MKRVLSLIVAVMMLATLVIGCGKSDKDTSKKAESTAAAETKKAAQVVDKTPITFKMYSADTSTQWDNFQSPVAKKITEATGVTLDIEFAVGDPKQKLALMAASGEYPDLVYAKGDVDILVKAGGLIKLNDLIDKHGPNIKKLFGKYYNRLRYSKEDPSIYFTGSFGVGDENWEIQGGFELQHAVVKEAGYPKIRTIQDYENAIKAYKDKHPTIDGQKTIGLSLLADDWRFLISVTNPAVFATGGPDDGEWYVDPTTKKAVLHHTRPEEKEYFRWLNHMNDIDLLDPESFVQKYDQYKAKIASGRVLGLIDSLWEYEEAEHALVKAGKEERGYGHYPVTMNETILYHEMQDPGYSAGQGVSITTSCKNPERAIQFIDWMCTEEAQILTNWGIEGKDYDVVDGKRVAKPEIIEARKSDPNWKKRTGIENYSYPFPQYGKGVKDSTGNYYQYIFKDTLLSKRTNADIDTLKAYKADLWADLFPQRSEFPVKEWGYLWQLTITDNDIKAIATECQDIGKKRIPEAIMAKPADFDGIWAKYMKELDNAGRQKLEDAMNVLLQQRLEMWK